MTPGAFVRVFFPTQEKPRQPGLLHIGYVLGKTEREAMVAYTTSRTWPAGTPLPAGVRLFDTAQAALLNQSRAFVLRLDILAKLPLTTVWFPDIDKSGQGVISVAPRRVQEELADLAANLVLRRRDLMQMRGV
jgi:hypothetical protein